MKTFARLAAVVVIGFSLAAPVSAHDSGDADAVHHLIMQTFDKPEAPLTVEPVTVEADIAVAGWAQGDTGGRALLRKKNGNWSLVLCSGDALIDAAALQKFGLTPERAEALASAVIAAEAKLDPTLVVKLSRFDGVVVMDSDGGHPPVDADHAPKH